MSEQTSQEELKQELTGGELSTPGGRRTRVRKRTSETQFEVGGPDASSGDAHDIKVAVVSSMQRGGGGKSRAASKSGGMDVSPNNARRSDALAADASPSPAGSRKGSTATVKSVQFDFVAAYAASDRPGQSRNASQLSLQPSTHTPPPFQDTDSDAALHDPTIFAAPLQGRDPRSVTNSPTEDQSTASLPLVVAAPETPPVQRHSYAADDVPQSPIEESRRFLSLGRKTQAPRMFGSNRRMSGVDSSSEDWAGSGTSPLAKETLLNAGSHRSIHSYDPVEVQSCTEWITNTLHPERDGDLMHLFPDGKPLTAYVPPDRQLFSACRDGWLLAKMLNVNFPSLVDLKQLKQAPKMKIQATSNLKIVLDRAQSIGVRLHNIGPEDVYAGTPQLCLGVIWQVIKVGLLARIKNAVNNSHQMSEIFGRGSNHNLASMSHENILQRWVNYHLRAAGVHRELQNFNVDLNDGEIYAALLAQLAPTISSDAASQVEVLYEKFQAMPREHADERASLVVKMAEELDLSTFLTTDDLLNGHRDHALAFLAQVFDRTLEVDQRLRDEKRSLQSSVNDLRSELQQAKLSASLQNLPPADLQDKERTIQMLQNQLASVQDTLRQSEEEKLQIRSQQELIRDEKLELQKKLNRLSLQDAHAVSQKSLDSTALTPISHIPDAKMQAAQEEVRRLKSELESMNTERVVLKAQNDKLQQETISSRLKLDKIVAELGDLRESNDSYMSEKERLTREREELLEKINDLNAQLKQTDSSILERTQQQESAVQDLKVVESRLDAVTKERRTLETLIIDAFEVIQSAIKHPLPEDARLDRRSAIANRGPSSRGRSATGPGSRPSSSSHVIPWEVHALVDETQQLSRYYKEVVDKLEQTLEQKKEQEEKVAQLQRGVPALQKKVSQLEQEVEHYKVVELPQRQATIDRHEANLKAKDAEINKLQEQMQVILSEKDYLQSSEAQLKEARDLEMTALKSQIQQLETQLKAREMDVNNWRATCETLRSAARTGLHVQVNNNSAVFAEAAMDSAQAVSRLNSPRVTLSRPGTAPSGVARPGTAGGIENALDGAIYPKAERLERMIFNMRESMLEHPPVVENNEVVRAQLGQWLDHGKSETNGTGFYGIRAKVENVNATLREK